MPGAQPKHSWRDRFPPTITGSSILLIAIAIGLWSYRSSDIVLWLASLSAVTIILIASLSVLLSAPLIFRSAGRRPIFLSEPIHCESPKATGFQIGLVNRLPFLDIKVKWIDRRGECIIEDVSFDRGIEKITPKRRGLLKDFRREFKISDIIGLTEVKFSKEASYEEGLVILPAFREPISPESLLRLKKVGGGDNALQKGEPEGDRIDIRHFQQGDPVRFMHWKLVAKFGGTKKFIRAPERVADQCVAIYLIGSSGDDGSAELAYYVLHENLFGRNWIFGTTASGEETAGFEALAKADRLIADSGTKKVPGEIARSNFEKFQKAALRNQAAYCLIFFPAGIAGEDGNLGSWAGSLATNRFRHSYTFIGVRGEEERRIAEKTLSDLGLDPLPEIIEI